MDTFTWVLDVAKVGAIGIISLVLLYSATLLKAELDRPMVRSPARNMIYAFMAFSAVCLFVAVGLEVWKMNHDTNTKVQVRAIDNAVTDKFVNEIQHVEDRTKKNNLLTFANDICRAVTILGKSVAEPTRCVEVPLENH
jgi:hypothetical protein